MIKSLFFYLFFLSGCVVSSLPEEKSQTNNQEQGDKYQFFESDKREPAGCGSLTQDFEIVIDEQSYHFSVPVPCSNSLEHPEDPIEKNISQNAVQQINNQ